MVYRFGHSMLTDTVDRLDNDLSMVNSDNVAEDDDRATRPDRGVPQSAGIHGQRRRSPMTATGRASSAACRGQVGNEIDEFVVEALRNNLLGLPLDLAALNIARGRDAGCRA